MKKSRRERLLIILLVLLSLILLASGWLLIRRMRREEETYEELREEVTEQTDESAEAEETEAEEPPNDVDWEALWERNPDIYAWIEIPGTQVDYPIVQRADDNHWYLTHTIDGEEATAASIYTENHNSTDFQDPNTVIYGHNMRSGAMFGSLHEYEDRAFFDENREILIYLPDATLHYRIFAAYVADNRHLMLSYDWTDADVMNAFLEQVFSIREMTANIDTEMTVTAEDRIITLSTCNHGISTQRYLVLAVLQEE